MRHYKIDLRCSRLGCAASLTEIEFEKDIDCPKDELDHIAYSVLKDQGWIISDDRQELICPECQDLEKRPLQ